jgi:acetoacetyl-CoA reductase
MEESRLMDKVAIVTGGTRGIGYSITRALAEEGYRLAAIYHGNEEAAKKCVEETGAYVFKADVADSSACQAVVAKIEAELGAPYLLVNNAGITRDSMLHKMEDAAWHDVLTTNLTSCFNMSRAVIGGMRARGQGRIVNISSINGQKGQLGQTNYAAAKAGMLGFTKALALESAAKNVTVNAICPGYIETDMTSAMDARILQSIIGAIPAGRMGRPEEVAELVVYLASDKAGFMNGATLSLNGGQYMA